MNARIALIYTTFGSAEEARRVAMALLQEKLIACANHLSPILSQYEWPNEKGKRELCEEQEFPVLLKTGATKVDAAMSRLRELHSFDTPAIISWNADGVDADYAKWLHRQVQDAQTV